MAERNMIRRMMLMGISAFILLMTTACAANSAVTEPSAEVSGTQAAEQTPAQPTQDDEEQSTQPTYSASPESSPAEETKRTAKDDANMQTEDPDMPTRVLEEGTRINMHFGDVVIPGILNDSDTAQALIELLPYTVKMNSYSHDFCGVMPDDLPYNEDEVHYGWLNGDIDYAINAPYFTILHSDEDVSEQYGYQVNIGVIDCDLAKIRDLSGSYDVLIELAE